MMQESVAVLETQVPGMYKRIICHSLTDVCLRVSSFVDGRFIPW